MNSSKDFIAHIDSDTKRVHLLNSHLLSSAKLASSFASSFDSSNWAYLAGLWHDIGKYSLKFQEKLTKDNSIRVDHSTAGAKYAISELGDEIGLILAYLIAGHHSGLLDFSSSKRRNTLKNRLTKSIEPYNNYLPKEIKEPNINLNPPKNIRDFKTTGALWIRMLFSSLVDADFLDTESFFNPKNSSLRGSYLDIKTLLDKFNSYISKLQSKALDTKVNRVRDTILKQCIDKAKLPTGVYSLNAPTGGGKTLSSMAFALNHALLNNKRRVIYVIPYTSIIEQNANIYREIFGNLVIEHHSQLAIDDDSSEEFKRAKLLAENWDAPIIVTTTVQFFESLFANKSSKLRKLHNIANSIVIIDEVQTLNANFLKPIVDKIDTLNKEYGVTFLLSSATLPTFGSFELFDYAFKGLKIDKEIINNPKELSQELQRVKTIWDYKEPKSYEKLAKEILSKKESILSVLNSRDRAKRLYLTLLDELRDSNLDIKLFHLSANMCAEHRSRVIESIKKRLSKGLLTLTVSTNLIEAGVDLDFPKVYRELAGLDSIAQSAGRCNREGKLDKLGEVHIFSLNEPIPQYLKTAISIMRSFREEIEKEPLSPATFRLYFQNYYKRLKDALDEKDITTKESSFPKIEFQEIAKEFKLIDDSANSSLIIPYDKRAKELIDSLEYKNDRYILRKLQRYTINLPKSTIDYLLNIGSIKRGNLTKAYILIDNNLYQEDIGFNSDKINLSDPEELYF